MKCPRPLAWPGLCLAFALLSLLIVTPALAYGEKDWLPVEPSLLSMSAPVVEKDADAEVIFWEVRVTYDSTGSEPATNLSHYVRIKIFNERGREAHSRVDILAPKVFGRGVKIKDIAGRTIKPDGQIVELKKEDIFERDVVKSSGVKVKAKSFAMPSVEPGAVVEYRWREQRDGVSRYERFDFSRGVPVQTVRYSIKPAGETLYSDGEPMGLRAQTFHGQMSPFKKEKDGSYTTSMSNVPAFREEPRMPPENAVRPWMLVFYAPDRKQTPAEFWRGHGKRMHDFFKGWMKTNDEVKAAAASAVGDAQTPEQKLEKLYNFVRAKIKRVTDDALGLTPDQLKKIKENKSPSDTLKRAMGTGFDINMLFGAMASAAGFEVRVASSPDREDDFFNPDFADDIFIQDGASVAVRLGDGWRLFDPGSSYVPFGMLRWQEEGQPTLVTDPKEPLWITSPNSGPSKSLEKRTGKFKLDADGTLEGDVRIEYTGHLAADIKEYNDDESPASREEILKEKFKSRLGGAEFSAVSIENVTDPDKPFVYSFHIRVPGYAQRTGKRLFLTAGFFQRGVGPLFPTTQRRHDVYFHYPWSEEDYVEIDLPEGFALDNAESPAPFGANQLARYEPQLGVTKDGRKLVYRRKFFFGGAAGGGGASMIFPTSAYGQLKTFFDQLHTQDAHSISLKQAAPAAGGGN